MNSWSQSFSRGAKRSSASHRILVILVLSLMLLSSFSGLVYHNGWGEASAESGRPESAPQPVEESLLVHRSMILQGGEPSQSPSRGSRAIEDSSGKEDLASTGELSVTSGILRTANELESPEDIFLFVHNTVDYEPYWGSLKGAEETLFEGAGNDLDQASLLIALYRSQGIPARYVHGTSEMSIGQAMNWLGVEDEETAFTILQENGIPSSATRDGGDIVSISFDHIWVAAYFDADGDGPKTADWQELDPSFKQYSYQAPAETPDYLVEAGEVIEDFVSNVSATRGGDVVNLNQASEITLSAVLEDSLIQEVANGSMDYLLELGVGNLTTDSLEDAEDIFRKLEEDQQGSRTIQEAEELPAALPLTSSMLDSFSSLPDSLRHSLSIRLGGIDFTAPTAELVGKRVLLDYLPSTAEDSSFIENFKGSGSFPAGAVNETPFLRVDGVILAIGEPAYYGDNQTLELVFSSPSGSGMVNESRNLTLTVGGLYVLGLDLQRLSGEVLSRRQDRLSATKQLLDLGFEDVSREELVGELFTIAALSYFKELDDHAAGMGARMGVVWTRQPSAVLVGTSFSKEYDGDGKLTGVEASGIVFDVLRDIINAYPARSGADTRSFMAQTGYKGSELEHYVLDEILSAPAVSTQKVFQIASLMDIPIYQLDMGNYDDLKDEVEFPEGEQGSIEAALQAGYTVSIPRDHVQFNSWKGTAWLIEDPDTGALSPMISGGYAGGLYEVFRDLSDPGFWDSFFLGYGASGGVGKTIELIFGENAGQAASNVVGSAITVVSSTQGFIKLFKDNPCNTLENIYQGLMGNVIGDGSSIVLSMGIASIASGGTALLAGLVVSMTVKMFQNSLSKLMDLAMKQCGDFKATVSPGSIELGHIPQGHGEISREVSLNMVNNYFVTHGSYKVDGGYGASENYDLIGVNVDLEVFPKHDNLDVAMQTTPGQFEEPEPLGQKKVFVGQEREESFKLVLASSEDVTYEKMKPGRYQVPVTIRIHTRLPNMKDEIIEKRMLVFWTVTHGDVKVSPSTTVRHTYRLGQGQSKIDISEKQKFTITLDQSYDSFNTEVEIRGSVGSGIKVQVEGDGGKWQDHGSATSYSFNVLISGKLGKGFYNRGVVMSIYLLYNSDGKTLEKKRAFSVPISVLVMAYKDPKYDGDGRDREREKGDDERLQKMNGDNPDDTFDVTGAFLSPTSTFDTTLRYAVHRGLGQAARLNDYRTLVGSHVFGDVADEKDAYKRHSAELALRYQGLVDNIQAISSEMGQAPYIALLDTGYSDAMSAYLSHLDEPFTLVSVDFDSGIVKYHPVLIVASGGFYGLDNSEVLKAKLERYAQMGGTIISFTQQYGYEFAPLPGTVDGYGWLQDQRCQQASVIIDHYVHAFAWSASPTLSINADGYFTDYPDNATVLLKRRVNDQAAMIMYPWGEGKVVVSDAYPAYNYAYVGVNWQEDAFTRNLLQWAYEYYAATEGGGTYITSEEWLEKPGSVGQPAPGAEVVVMDDDGERLPAGEVGAVYFKAPEVGRFEYYKDHGKTDSAYRGNYFTLGDRGYIDEDGYVFLTGRTAEMIISGGVNIYPAEVDEVLLMHPAVADVATVGVPNEEWGEEVKSVVQPAAGADPGEALKDELIQFCRERLAHYKCPRSIDFDAELPRAETGKIYRRRVRDRYWQGRERQI